MRVTPANPPAVATSTRTAGRRSTPRSRTTPPSQTTSRTAPASIRRSAPTPPDLSTTTGTTPANPPPPPPPITNASPTVAAATAAVKNPCDPCEPAGGGKVDQNSGSTINAPVTNNASQSNTQTNVLGQAQTVSSDEAGRGCCSKGRSGETEQEATQSNDGSNSANQTEIGRAHV